MKNEEGVNAPQTKRVPQHQTKRVFEIYFSLHNRRGYEPRQHMKHDVCINVFGKLSTGWFHDFTITLVGTDSLYDVESSSFEKNRFRGCGISCDLCRFSFARQIHRSPWWWLVLSSSFASLPPIDNFSASCRVHGVCTTACAAEPSTQIRVVINRFSHAQEVFRCS